MFVCGVCLCCVLCVCVVCVCGVFVFCVYVVCVCVVCLVAPAIGWTGRYTGILNFLAVFKLGICAVLMGEDVVTVKVSIPVRLS